MVLRVWMFYPAFVRKFTFVRNLNLRKLFDELLSTTRLYTQLYVSYPVPLGVELRSSSITTVLSNALDMISFSREYCIPHLFSGS